MAANSHQDFYYAVLKQSVARSCRTVGWHGVHTGTCDILTDLLARYIRTIGRTASAYANLAERANPNTFDLDRTFADMGICEKDLLYFVKNIDINPVSPLPHLPVQRPQRHLHNGTEQKILRSKPVIKPLDEDNEEMEREEGEESDGEGAEIWEELPGYLPPLPNIKKNNKGEPNEIDGHTDDDVICSDPMEGGRPHLSHLRDEEEGSRRSSVSDEVVGGGFAQLPTTFRRQSTVTSPTTPISVPPTPASVPSAPFENPFSDTPSDPPRDTPPSIVKPEIIMSPKPAEEPSPKQDSPKPIIQKKRSPKPIPKKLSPKRIPKRPSPKPSLKKSPRPKPTLSLSLSTEVTHSEQHHMPQLHLMSPVTPSFPSSHPLPAIQSPPTLSPLTTSPVIVSKPLRPALHKISSPKQEGSSKQPKRSDVTKLTPPSRKEMELKLKRVSSPPSAHSQSSSAIQQQTVSIARTTGTQHLSVPNPQPTSPTSSGSLTPSPIPSPSPVSSHISPSPPPSPPPPPYIPPSPVASHDSPPLTPSCSPSLPPSSPSIHSPSETTSPYPAETAPPYHPETTTHYRPETAPPYHPETTPSYPPLIRSISPQSHELSLSSSSISSSADDDEDSKMELPPSALPPPPPLLSYPSSHGMDPQQPPSLFQSPHVPSLPPPPPLHAADEVYSTSSSSESLSPSSSSVSSLPISTTPTKMEVKSLSTVTVGGPYSTTLIPQPSTAAKSPLSYQDEEELDESSEEDSESSMESMDYPMAPPPQPRPTMQQPSPSLPSGVPPTITKASPPEDFPGPLTVTIKKLSNVHLEFPDNTGKSLFKATTLSQKVNVDSIFLKESPVKLSKLPASNESPLVHQPPPHPPTLVVSIDRDYLSKRGGKSVSPFDTKITIPKIVLPDIGHTDREDDSVGKKSSSSSSKTRGRKRELELSEVGLDPKRVRRRSPEPSKPKEKSKKPIIPPASTQHQPKGGAAAPMEGRVTRRTRSQTSDDGSESDGTGLKLKLKIPKPSTPSTNDGAKKKISKPGKKSYAANSPLTKSLSPVVEAPSSGLRVPTPSSARSDKLLITSSTPKKVSSIKVPKKAPPSPSPPPVLSIPKNTLPRLKMSIKGSVKVKSEPLTVGGAQSSEQEIYICPMCERPDDGTPMICCDNCDIWLHMRCVGLTRTPPENEVWYCSKCSTKKKRKKKK